MYKALDNPDDPKEQLVRSWLEQILKILALSSRNGEENKTEANRILHQIMYENYLQELNKWASEFRGKDVQASFPYFDFGFVLNYYLGDPM